MRRIISVLLIIILLFTGCKKNDGAVNETTNLSNDTNVKSESNEKKLNVITTLFPNYSFAKAIAPNADVKLLLPPGADSHSFEPTPDDIISLQNADMVVYTTKHMEEWFEKTIDAIELDQNKIVMAAKDIKLKKNKHNHGHEDEEVCDVCGHVHAYDPHVWTNPVMAKKMAENIYNKFVEIDADNKEEYTKNCNALIKELDDIDSEIREIVKTGKRDEIFFGSRFAMSYFVREYDLDVHSVYDNCTSHSEPNPKEMADIIEEMKEENIPVIFYEELIDPKLANQIAEETGAKAMLMHSCHNLSKEDFDNGKTYVEIMKENAEALKAALN